MNTDKNINASPVTDPREPLRSEDADAMLTAHALEQLEGHERASVERLLADPARQHERRMVEEVRQTAAVLRADRTTDALQRSAALRHAVVAAIAVNDAKLASDAKPAAPAIASEPGRGWTNRGMMMRFAIAGTLAATVLVLVTAAFQMQTAFNSQAGRQVAQLGSERRKEGLAAAPQDRSEREAKAAIDQLPATTSAVKAQVEKSSREVDKAIPAPGAKATPRRAPEAELRGAANGTADVAMAAAASAPGVSESAAGGPALQRERRIGGKEFAKERDWQTGERYDRLMENRVFSTREQPLSTFSIDVDTASYANVRRFLSAGRLPPHDAVRIEEMINYFRYEYPQPEGDRPFSVTVEAAECPWSKGRRLVRIGLQGRDIDRRERPAGNLVFLVDVSGSMSAANKLPLVKQALAMLVEELTENDSVAIVTYAGDAGLKLAATSGDQKQKIRAAIESLSPGGSTHGSAGINVAYEQAAERFIDGGVNRVILATDGDLNVGVTSDAALVDLIRQKAAGGTFLTVLGFGDGNLQDAKMEKIADNGNGVYAYIDGAREARKVLVEQLTGSTITIAKDVKIQVEFNPAQVASYRLLGYENRVMAAEDFRNDRKDAGEIGAGHSVTALYEITLAGDSGEGSTGAEPLKYQPSQPKPALEAVLVDGETSRELLTVKLRWKKPEGDASTLDEVPLVDRGGAFEQASADLQFAGAVAAFGMVLRNSEYKGEATLPLVAKIAAGALGPDRGGYRAEFLDLVRKADTLRDGGR
jgi:secreted protein with Ig-like and vWFA domain